MTREEQMMDIASQYAINETDGQNGGKAASKRGLLLSAFRNGAEWADESILEKIEKYDLSTYGRLHNCWHGMIQRCTNPKATGYKNYGGIQEASCRQLMKMAIAPNLLQSHQTVC